MHNRFQRTIILALILLPLSLLLQSWGYVGHSMISVRAQLSFNEEMQIFNDWMPYLAEHSSDADRRKGDDPSEGPKHYIDLDNYDSYNSNGRIPHTLDSCITEYGATFVEKQGYLPWATLTSYDSLVACLRRGDVSGGKKHAADLCHYVADGHMPLHLTRNYDGQFSGNKGIHYRYESEMINEYHEQISYGGQDIAATDNVRSYIFTYLYENYPYLETILQGDDKAAEADPSMTDEDYYSTLWAYTKGTTQTMYERASHAIAELFYTALLESQELVAMKSDNLNGQISRQSEDFFFLR